MEKGNHVDVWKGTHKGKTGVIIKIHRVYVSIRFLDGSEGKTLPSSVRIINHATVPIVEVEQEERVPHHVYDRTHDLERFRDMSIEVITEMMAQGMALSDHTELELEQELIVLKRRIQDIRRRR